MSKLKKIIIWLWIFSLFVLLSILAINLYVLSFSKTNYYTSIDELEQKYVGIVLWAAVYNNSTPSWILKDRLQVAYDAYEAWKIKKILVSGDNSQMSYNEPEVMKNYLIELWVKKDDIYLDYAGFETYDSVYRAKDVFLTNELVIFTQDFHLKRAMYISKKLWIDTFGVETNLQKYLREDYYDFREIFARIKAFIYVEILKPKPKYLGDPIEILSDEQIEEVKKWILEQNYWNF